MNKIIRPYIIGIDLGTTNCAVSCVNRSKNPESRKIELFQVPQLSGAGELTTNPVLPSFLYLPGDYEISKDALSLPWATQEDDFSGIYARELGAKIPARLVSSAKSWLCHGNVDRLASILPWGASQSIQKKSPVDASAAYLNHIKKAWNHNKKDDPELYLENQFITVTVPASFDEVARDLTIAAAKKAGLGDVTLIEEPLAAFYSWLALHEDDWSSHVKPGELILVCDVGGGTTDFTLIALREAEGGSPRFDRLAVGDHLILGGDNIDLALARLVEMKLGKSNLSISGDRWKTLCHLSRTAKERILDRKSDRERITIMGEGGKLISGTLSAELDYEDMLRIVVDGFFPLVNPEDTKKSASRKAITEFGLPYEGEPAITRHLGWFLEKHRADVEKALGKAPVPDHVLFNGGSLKPQVIQDRIIESIREWFGTDQSLSVLENHDPDLAVALGASYYGLVKSGSGVRVGSGSPRSYYLGVGGIESEKNSAVCLVERGLDEGTKIELDNRDFEVLANRAVSFDVYSSSFRSGDRMGDIIEIDDSFSALPPVQTVVSYGKKGDEIRVPVHVAAEYTEVGSLRLWCRSLISPNRWELSFQLRQKQTAIKIAKSTVIEESVVLETRKTAREAFEPSGNLQGLARDIAAIAGSVREKWPLPLIRAVADELLEIMDRRSVSANHESRWLNLTGFCMRPGFGDALDEYRIQRIWKIYREGRLHSKNAQVNADWWIFWRRIAGGLKPGQQRQFYQDVAGLVIPRKNEPVKLSPKELQDIWMALVSMEYLSQNDKTRLGKALIPQLSTKKDVEWKIWAVSRLGARELLYGSADRVIAPSEASVWAEKIMKSVAGDKKIIASALSRICSKTGDRVRDISPETAQKVLEWFRSDTDLDSFKYRIKNIVPMEESDRDEAFGEALPPGLFLAGQE